MVNDRQGETVLFVEWAGIAKRFLQAESVKIGTIHIKICNRIHVKIL